MNGDEVNTSAGYLLSARKHSNTCRDRLIKIFETIYKWSLFRIILFCGVNDIPFMRDFVYNIDHSMICMNAISCAQCIVCYQYNFLFTGFRNKSNRYLVSIIRKLDGFYKKIDEARISTLIKEVFKMTIAHENTKIFKFMLYYYADRLTMRDINDVIIEIHGKRETIDLDFLTVCLERLSKYVNINDRMRELVRNITAEQLYQTATIWREIVELRIFCYTDAIIAFTPLFKDIIEIINGYNYINPDIRSYL